MSKRVRLTQEEAKILGLEFREPSKHGNNKYRLNEEKYSELLLLRNNSSTPSNNYKMKPSVVLSAWNNNTSTMMDIDEYCKRYKLPLKDITSYKLVSHTGTPFYNIVFKTIVEKIKDDLTEEFITDTIRKLIVPVKVKEYSINLDYQKFDRLIYTDCHIGMDTNKGGSALYPVVWDKDRLMIRLNVMVNHVRINKKGDLLVVDDLGDLLDGWDEQTVRKGHHLPQNMDNKQAFDAALMFKVTMAQELANIYDHIQFNNICEDNHSGSFGYIVNSAFKQIIETQFKDRISVINHEQFINHYTVFDKHFVISHGKDSKNLKFGFKPHLDPKQIEKIDQYIKYHNLYDGKLIEFSKGDSHQLLFDMASSDDFDYMNYLALSPSSEWVQTNFKKGRSGFVIQNHEGKNRTITPYFF